MTNPKPVQWKTSGDPEGWDGPIVESDEQKAARKLFEAQYDDPKPQTAEVDEYGDPVDVEDAEPWLREAAQVLDDPMSSVADKKEARETLLGAPGLEEFAPVEDAEDEPLTRQQRIAEMAEGVRLGNAPIDDYANPRFDGPGDYDEAVQAVGREMALQDKVKELLGQPGYQHANRSPEEIAAIQAVREAMLRQQGIELSDMLNAPEVDAQFEADVASDYLEWDKTLGLEPGTSAAQGAKDDAAFDAGGLE